LGDFNGLEVVTPFFGSTYYLHEENYLTQSHIYVVADTIALGAIVAQHAEVLPFLLVLVG